MQLNMLDNLSEAEKNYSKAESEINEAILALENTWRSLNIANDGGNEFQGTMPFLTAKSDDELSEEDDSLKKELKMLRQENNRLKMELEKAVALEEDVEERISKLIKIIKNLVGDLPA